MKGLTTFCRNTIWTLRPAKIWTSLLINALTRKIFNRRHTEIFFFFLVFQKTGFCIPCKLSPVDTNIETTCMKCQILFSGKNMINITNLSSAELAWGVVKVNTACLGHSPLSINAAKCTISCLQVGSFVSEILYI